MKAAKRIILILLPVLLIGALLLHPLVRFTVNLYLDRFDQAASVYLASIRGNQRFDGRAQAQLQQYVDRQVAAYYRYELSYGEVTDALSPLLNTGLPQEDVARSLQAIHEMETARNDLNAADACAAAGDYARAIPLYRQSLIADEGAAYRLEQAQIAYKNSVLDQAEAAMASGQLDTAETALQDGQRLLGADGDFDRALLDVQRMRKDAAYAAATDEAKRLLREAGPEAAFRYAGELRQQTPDAYEYEYLEQLVRHQYEDDICSNAQSLRAAGDLSGACALLEEGLRWLDSQRMRSLRQEIRAAIPCWLVDMPLSMDETAGGRTGAESTVARNLILFDSLSNEYTSSFWADLGSVSISLKEGFEAFTGTVAFPRGEASDIYRASATLQVFGDGRLIAEFRDMDGTSAPQPFSIPLAGIGELTLCWTSAGADGWRDWGRFATVFDGRLIPPGGC